MVRRWSASETEADQKAGAQGSQVTRNISRTPARPTASRARDPNRCETDGGVNPTLRRRRRTRRPVLREAVAVPEAVPVAVTVTVAVAALHMSP